VDALDFTDEWRRKVDHSDCPIGTLLSYHFPERRSCCTMRLKPAVTSCALPIPLGCPADSQNVTSGQRPGQCVHSVRRASLTGAVSTGAAPASAPARRRICTARSTVDPLLPMHAAIGTDQERISRGVEPWTTTAMLSLPSCHSAPGC
jgi:hypothetical protein